MDSHIKKEIIQDINNLLTNKMKKKRISDIISIIRLITFIIGLIIALLLWKNDHLVISLWALFLTFLIFSILVKIHQKINFQINWLGCLIEINQKDLDRKCEKWTDFSDDGAEFINPNHVFTNDLDIFGKKSLFQWVNNTNTFYGRIILKTILETPETNIKEIQIRQKAIQELAQKKVFCQSIQCEGKLAKGSEVDPGSLIEYAHNPIKCISNKWVRKSYSLIAGLTIMSVIAIITDVNIPLYIPLVLILVQAFITLFGYREISSILNEVHQFRANIKTYEKIIKIIEEAEFKEPKLYHMKQLLIINNNLASLVMKKLDYIIEAIDLRYNSISYVVLNFLLLWDYHCVFVLEEWKEKYGVVIDKWFYTIGYFEAFSSLANVARLNSQWCFPTFNEDGLVFSARELGHPLILDEQRICNNIDINNEICVITGSNMSGKTTMLRTIGINLVLAFSGAPVCANSLKCSVMDIVTSMRIHDDLGNGISTFYAELLRIKIIIDRLQQKEPMIFLIDEIFRGTNSNDRIVGAISVLRNLSKPWVIGLISTHDFELCNVKNSTKKITNYHFNETYSDTGINFDYKIYQGRCTTTNAKYLMKMVGIDVLE